MLTHHQARVASPRALSDADLIGRSLAEPGCFGEIFDRHADEILRYAYARLGPDLAQDVVAETFLAAFARRDRYDTTRADARPWLYGIAIRQISRHRRAGARQLRPRLAAVLAGLSRDDRELLLLVAWAGLSYAESAQALGLTVSAVLGVQVPPEPDPDQNT